MSKNVAANNISIALDGARIDLCALQADLKALGPSGHRALVTSLIKRQEAFIEGIELALECANAQDFDEDWIA